MARFPLGIAAAALLGFTTLPATAQDFGGWSFDPGALVADGRELLMRAPDASIDGLFQAVHASARSPQDARTLCTLFDPDAPRSLEGYNRIATQLSEPSRVRFANAATDFFIAAAQSPRQPYDAALATQALKAAGVRAALLNDGFLAGLSGGDHDARCRSVGWLIDAMASRPVAERASVMRLLLSQGIDYLSTGAGAPR
ncbi:hypothetical protein [Lysobacter arvi]|uniref:Rhodanese domain-containing protein n=1 Tax=Lysobacter arvi TaxID=3038776 RepID=A0ABU1CHU8_9GAMM|nr:hypothetical protein [Lysobacter arvi]MDR0184522.1 hypothetical protein [Lysobacter arvi]